MPVERDDPTGSTLSGGRYTITAKLGEGGMGAVYRAQDNNLGTDVVIKFPHRSMLIDATFSRRFRDEIGSLVRLSHPHIVKVTDIGEWDGLPFAVLQFLPGGSLEGRFSAWRGPVALAELAGWVEPVGRALDYVHSQRMVHRDVKPANILFDEQGHAFLGDFGVVKVLASADDRAAKSAMTGAGMVLGTPQYMGPELIRGTAFDGRVDQYALAVTVYELLCGRRPFEHDVPTAVLVMQTSDPVPSPESLAPWLPRGLTEAILKGLAKDPAERFPTCSAFASAVAEAVGLRAGDPSPRPRIRCATCGQTIRVAADSLAKLVRTGRTAPCPHCQASLVLTAGSLAPGDLATPLAGDTRTLEIVGQTPGSDDIPRSSANRTVAMKAGQGSGTVALPLAGESNTIPIDLARAGKTVALPRSGKNATIAINPERAGKTVAIAGLGATDCVEPIGSARPFPVWIAATFAAVASAVVVGAGVFWMTSSGSVKSPVAAAVPNIATAPPPAAALPASALSSPPPPAATASALPPPPVPQNKRAETSTLPEGESKELANAIPSGLPRSDNPGPRMPPEGQTNQAAIGPLALRSPSRPGPAATKGQRQRRPPRGAPNTPPAGTVKSLGDSLDRDADRKYTDDALLKREPLVADDAKPSQRNVPLKKLLDSPDLYSGMLITLEQTYSLGKTPRRMPDGSLQIPLLETDLQLRPTMRIREGNEFALGLDGRLAEQLSELGKLKPAVANPSSSDDWNINQPSNLYVKVADHPTPGSGSVGRIVRLEMFKSFTTEINNKSLGVRILTETVSQSGKKDTIASDDEWSRTHKFQYAYKQFKDMRDSAKRQKNRVQEAMLDAMINKSVNDAAAQFAAGQAAAISRMRRSLGGP